MKRSRGIVSILVATIWISASEFVRNELLLKSYWNDHYDELGLVFPAEPANGATWGLWALLLAGVLFVVRKKFCRYQTIILGWIVGFAMMWIVIGNLGVLPYGILVFAIPLSILEVFVAVLILEKLSIRRGDCD